MEGFAGKVAVVTGAGSGIGQALAVELARSGAKVAISDVNPEGLAVTAERLRAIGADVKADRLDVSDGAAFAAYAESVNEHFGKVNQIYNNAGMGFYGDVEITRLDEIKRVMDVDYWGVVHGTKAFLPYLIASGDGHVVNVSSAFGLFAVPGQAAYNSAKFAVRGFTEALNQEMTLARQPVRVSTVFPGGVPSSFVSNLTLAEELPEFDTASTFNKPLWSTPPEKAAQVILQGVRKKRSRIMVGPDTKVLDFLVRMTGSGYQWLVPRVGRLFMKPIR